MGFKAVSIVENELAIARREVRYPKHVFKREGGCGEWESSKLDCCLNNRNTFWIVLLFFSCVAGERKAGKVEKVIPVIIYVIIVVSVEILLVKKPSIAFWLFNYTIFFSWCWLLNCLLSCETSFRNNLAALFLDNKWETSL